MDYKNIKRDKAQIVEILRDSSEENLKELFDAASEVRNKKIGNKIFAYGFVYFTTYCRRDCNFCYFRKSNDIERYRKTYEEIILTSKALIDSGVNLIDLTMGEDMNYHEEEFETVVNIIKEIKETYNTPVMISPGVVENKIIDEFARAGADWYALYQETHNKELFASLRINQSYEERMNAKLYARDKGMLIEEGLLAGVGENDGDIADSILTMGDIGAKQVRVMSFVPQAGSPMENYKEPDRNEELKIISIMRLLYPDALIPASLDVDGISGLEDRINAGANLITSIIPPQSGFMGVAHNVMDVDEGGRTVDEARKILGDMGLRIATCDEYKDYINYLKTV